MIDRLCLKKRTIEPAATTDRSRLEKSAIVQFPLNRDIFHTLPTLQEVEPSRADIAWFVYDLVHDTHSNVFQLKRWKAIYTKFNESLEKITRSEPGDMNDFLEVLQGKVDEKLDNNPPDTEVIDAPF